MNFMIDTSILFTELVRMMRFQGHTYPRFSKWTEAPELYIVIDGILTTRNSKWEKNITPC